VRNNFIILAIVMLIIWASFLAFLWVKADEITKDPCSICANKTDTTVMCTKFALGSIPVNKFYYPNGTETTNRGEIEDMINRESKKDIYGNINFNSFNLIP